MTGRIDAVCVAGADLLPLPGRRPDRSGIDKHPVAGRVAVHPLGLDGDVQVNKKHHGGEGQAVTSSSVVPTCHRSPRTASRRSSPVVLRFSPNRPGGSSRPSSAIQNSASSWA